MGVFDLKPMSPMRRQTPCVASKPSAFVVIARWLQHDRRSQGGYVTYVEGNPDSPINKGSLCSKGSAAAQLSTVVSNDTGQESPTPEADQNKISAPGSTTWVDMDYLSAIRRITQRVKPQGFNLCSKRVQSPEAGLTVNRCEGIASLAEQPLTMRRVT